MFYKLILAFESVDDFLKCDIEMNATKQYFPAVLLSVIQGGSYVWVCGCMDP